MGMYSGQGRFDGMEVELYEGKFGGGFDLEDDEGERVSYDSTFVFMVTAIAGKTTFDVTNQGDVKRITQFDLRDVVVLDPEDANAQFVLQELANNLLVGEDEVPGQTTLQQHIDAVEEDDEEYPEYVPVPEQTYESDPEPEPEPQYAEVDEAFGSTPGAQTVGRVKPTKDSMLSNFLDGPTPG